MSASLRGGLSVDRGWHTPARNSIYKQPQAYHFLAGLWGAAVCVSQQNATAVLSHSLAVPRHCLRSTSPELLCDRTRGPRQAADQPTLFLLQECMLLSSSAQASRAPRTMCADMGCKSDRCISSACLPM